MLRNMHIDSGAHRESNRYERAIALFNIINLGWVLHTMNDGCTTIGNLNNGVTKRYCINYSTEAYVALRRNTLMRAEWMEREELEYYYKIDLLRRQ